MKYNKVTHIEVFINICDYEINGGYYPMMPKSITRRLKTSRYQVDKCIKELKKLGMIQYESMACVGEYEIYAPVNGYRITDKGKMTLHYKVLYNAWYKRFIEE